MKKKFKKQITTLALSLIMLIGIMPMPAFAVAYDTYDVSGRTQSGNNTAFIRYGLTDDSAGSFSISEWSSYVQLDLSLNDGWYLEKWDTWFYGAYDKAWASDPEYNERNPVFDGSYTFFNTYQTGPLTNAKYIIVGSLGFLYGDFRIDTVVRPILTVKTGDGVSYQVLADNPISVESGVAVEYGKNASVTYSVDEKHVVTGISANYGTQYSENGSTISVSSIVRPATINISTRLKQQNVIFDANGGEGTMAAQTFEHSVAQALSANAFTKTGYTFAGWNTNADGNGIDYTDGETVTFVTEIDGDSITLYAQWTQCTDHVWENGECTKCGTPCSHSGGDATCTEQATCDICGEKYGELAKHSVVYNSSNNRIVETCTAGCGHTATAELVLDTNVSTVYTGSAIEALKVVYSDNWQGGSLHIDYSDNVNVGTASGSVSISGAAATQTFTITAATMTDVSAQGYSGTYDGQAHGITVNAPEGATVSYKVGEGGYSAENPAFTNAGTYTVAYKVSMANYTDVEGTAEVTINKAPLTVTANDHCIKYGEAANNGGVTCSGFVSGETESVLGGTLDFDYTYSVGDNIGTYEITPKGLTSNNYIISFEKGTLTVEQKELTITWGNTSLVYNKTDQLPEYVADGILSGDDVQFIVTGAAKNAATLPYTAVITGITGDDAGNYKLPNNLSVEFTISRAKPDIGTVSVSETVYDTTKPKDVVLVRTNTEVPGRLSIEKAGDFMRADKTEYFWEFVPTDVENYEAIYGYVQIDVVDTTAPNANISINDHQWTLWHTVTFGLFYNENKVVTITSADNENGSGIKDTLYYVADREMSVEELQSVQWTVYTEAFEIDPDGEYVIYAKVVDNDGNITIINSDGVVLDKTAPVLAGITNGEAYYGDKVFKALDNYLDILKVDGVDVTAELNGDNEYEIIADNAEHTVTAIDKAGNVIEYKITVYKNYTVTYKADGETVSTETVGHGKDANLPAVPTKEGYAGKWGADGKNITADTVIEVNYAAVPAVDPNSVKPEDKADLEDTKKLLEDLLDDDGYTEDDKKVIQDAIDSVDDALKVIENVKAVEELFDKIPETITKNDETAIEAADDAYNALTDYEKSLVDEDAKKTLDDAKAVLAELNKPTDPNSPQTGDNSNIAVWISLLFISGGAVIALAVVERKKRTV